MKIMKYMKFTLLGQYDQEQLIFEDAGSLHERFMDAPTRERQ